MGDAARPLRIYLAGPEVFFPNALAQGEIKKRLCAEHGLEGVYPLDNEIISAGRTPEAVARAISLGNEGLMRSCDLLIANCTPFRGPSLDAGTAYEIGFMRALGKPVLGYANVAADYATRVRAVSSAVRDTWDPETRTADIENFGLADNLMIAIAILESAGQLVVRDVPADCTLSDLQGFRDCLTRVSALGRTT